MAYTRHEWIPNEIITTQKMNNLESLRDVISAYSPNITFAENWNVGVGYYTGSNNRLMTGTKENPVASVWGENETWVMDDPRNLCIYNKYTSTFLPCGKGDTVRFYAGQANNTTNFQTFGFVNKQGEVIAKASHSNVRGPHIGGEFCITAPAGSAYVFINVHTEQVNIDKAFLCVEKEGPGYYKYQNSDEIYYYDIAKHNNRTYVRNGLTINWENYRLTINGTHAEGTQTYIYLAHFLTCDYNDQARLLLLQPGHIYEARMRKISGSQTNANLELNFSLFHKHESITAANDGSNFPRDTHKISSGDNQYTRIRYLSQYSQGITPVLHILENSAEPAVFDNYCVEIRLFDITSRYMIAPVEHTLCTLEPHDIGDIVWVYDHELNYDGLYKVTKAIVQNESIDSSYLQPLRLSSGGGKNIVELIKNSQENINTTIESIDQNIANNTNEINKRLIEPSWEAKYNQYFVTSENEDAVMTINGNHFITHPTTDVGNNATVYVISNRFRRVTQGIEDFQPQLQDMISTSIFNDNKINLEIYRNQYIINNDPLRLIGIVCFFYTVTVNPPPAAEAVSIQRLQYQVSFRAVASSSSYTPKTYDTQTITIPDGANYVIIGLTDAKHDRTNINEGYIKIY